MKRASRMAAAVGLMIGIAATVASVPTTGIGAVPPAVAAPAGAGGTVESQAFADPGVLAYGDARYSGAPTQSWLSAPIVGMAANPEGSGYWLVAADGGVFAYGGAGFYGSAGAINLYGPIVGMAPTPDGKGYWLVALDGGIFSFGDARFYGSTGGIKLNQPIVGMAATPDGNGYWLVAADGGIFSFGDARFYGSTGNVKLDAPIVGMAVGPHGGGYWLVAADGGIFTFGDAPFEGSVGNRNIPDWVTGMATTPDGKGYWLANADGAVYTLGDASFYGNNANTPRTEIIADIAATPDGKGYWLLEPDAFPTAFSHPGGGGSIVSIATGQVRGDPVSGYFCNPYGPCEAWCALFATWVWATAHVPIPIYPFVGDVYVWAAQHTAVIPPTARPAPGDAVLYGTGPQNVATAVHMGIVAQVWPDGAIDTVEGDAGPGPPGGYNVIINGPFLPKDSATYNGFPIFAFAVP
jgi:hypothetical protein